MFGALKGESYVGAQALEQKGGRGNLLRPVTKKNSELCPTAGAGAWRQNLKQVMTHHDTISKAQSTLWHNHDDSMRFPSSLAFRHFMLRCSRGACLRLSLLRSRVLGLSSGATRIGLATSDGCQNQMSGVENLLELAYCNPFATGY